MASLVEILGIHPEPSGGIVVPCGIINKGINNAARLGGAAFRLDFTFAYLSNGKLVSQTTSVPVVETKAGGQFDNRSILFTTSITLQVKVDAQTEIHANVQLVSPGQAGGPDEPVGDPHSGNFSH
jgi:hypothetical protein